MAQPSGTFPSAAGSQTRPALGEPCSAPRQLHVASSLSDTAALRPAAMARLILRRVGIAPLLGLLAFLAPVWQPPPAHAGATIAATHRATARVIILRQSVRLQQGQISVENGQNSPFPTGSFVLPQPQERGCETSSSSTTSHSISSPQTPTSCRLITVDMP